jgi:hypothetical protein
MAGRSQKTAPIGSFLVEMILYAVFVFAYFFLVLHFLGDWVKHVFDENKTLYGVVALGLIITQGVALETLTTALLRMIRRWAR